MPLLSWYRSYSIKNDELDKHHQTLFGIFNALYDICNGKDKEGLFETAVDELLLYSDYHFKAEEKYMRDIGYKGIDYQITEHEYFREKVNQLKQKSKISEPMLCHDIIVFLGNWLMNHVIKEDKKIAL